MQWIVVIDSEPCAVGPFITRQEAEAYRDSDPERASVRVLEFWPPAQNWKRAAGRTLL